MEAPSKADFRLPIILSLVLILGMFLGFKMSNSLHRSSPYSSQSYSLDDFLALLDRHYVDSLNKDKLIQQGIEGIISELDPHTVYISKADLPRVNEQLQGNFYGIGIEFYTERDTVFISNIMKDGPANRESIYPGDRILKVNDSLVSGRKLSDEMIIEKIRGLEHSTVRIEVLHPDNKTQTISLKRAQIPQPSISAHYLINSSTAYIRINVFSETTYDEFHKALLELKKQSIQHLIIDVRDNPGGYMDAVTRIADELIDGKKLLLSTKGKNENEEVYSTPGGLFSTGKVSILINENAASASEILAGCIQDLDRGLVIGRRSFGKGLVQEQFELPGQAAIRITTARYYLPSGRCIQKSYKEGNAHYQQDIEERYVHGKLTTSDSISQQLKKYYTLKKRIVYEGEGIRPDLFTPVDTLLDRYLDPIFTNHLIEQICHQYFYFHRQEFSKYKSLESFSSQFTLPPVIVKDILLRASIYKPSCPAVLYSAFEEQLTRYSKAVFAQLLFHENGWMYMYNQNDKMIQTALKN